MIEIYNNRLPEKTLEEMMEKYLNQTLESLNEDQLREYARNYMIVEMSDCHERDLYIEEDAILSELNISEIGKTILQEHLSEDQYKKILSN